MGATIPIETQNLSIRSLSVFGSLILVNTKLLLTLCTDHKLALEINGMERLLAMRLGLQRKTTESGQSQRCENGSNSDFHTYSRSSNGSCFPLP